MTPLFLAAWLASGLGRISPAETLPLVEEAERQEERHGLPGGLLISVILIESAGRSLVVRRRCGWDVGPGQVHVHALGPWVPRERLARLLVLSTNLDAAAGLLARSRATCHRRPRLRHCRRSVWAGYNAGAPRWWPAVARVWARLRGYREPTV